MDQAEASGKTVDDALNRALAKLGASREEVEFVILDEGRKGGLFGRGAKDWVVRVERTDQPAEAEGSSRETIDTRIPRGQNRGGGASRGGRERTGGAAGAQRGPRPQGDRADRPDRGARAGGGGRPQSRTGLDAAAPRLSADDFARPKQPARGGGPGRADAPAGPPRAERPPRPERPQRASSDEGRSRRRPRDRDEEPRIDPDINAEEVDFAAHITDDLLQLLDINADITIREPLTAGEGLGSALAVIDISGDDLGLLIGRRGDTLLSMQYLVNLIVGRRYPERGNVTIDVEHYRHRREEQVLATAQRMADRVRETGSPITLEPMPASERRLVHLALADDPELETNSIGDGDNRKVVISKR